MKDAVAQVRTKAPTTFHRHRFPQSYNAAGHNVTPRQLLGPLDITERPKPIDQTQKDALENARNYGRHFIIVDIERNEAAEQAAEAEYVDDDEDEEPEPEPEPVAVEEDGDGEPLEPVEEVTTSAEAAEFLAGRGVPLDHLKDKAGRLHAKKIISAAESVGVDFPNYG